MSLRQPENKALLSLDIGHDSIKAMVTQADAEGLVCQKAAMMSLDKKAGTSLGEFLRLLKDLFSGWSFRQQGVRVALSGESITVRFIEVPPITKQQLLANVSYESGKYIPFALKDTYFDCDVFAAADGKKDNKATAVIAAVKREAVGDLAKLLHGLGFTAELLDVAPLALFNALEKFGPEQARQTPHLALLDIGSGESHFGVVHDGIPAFSRTLDVAGNAFTQAIAKAMGLDEQKAEAEKIKAGHGVADMLAGVFHQLATEIRHSFEFFETERGAAIKGMCLTGGGAKTAGLADALSQSLDIPVRVWNPLESSAIKISADASEKLREQGPLYAVCLGLAARAVTP